MVLYFGDLLVYFIGDGSYTWLFYNLGGSMTALFYVARKILDYLCKYVALSALTIIQYMSTQGNTKLDNLQWHGTVLLQKRTRSLLKYTSTVCGFNSKNSCPYFQRFKKYSTCSKNRKINSKMHFWWLSYHESSLKLLHLCFQKQSFYKVVYKCLVSINEHSNWQEYLCFLWLWPHHQWHGTVEMLCIPVYIM